MHKGQVDASKGWLLASGWSNLSERVTRPAMADRWGDSMTEKASRPDADPAADRPLDAPGSGSAATENYSKGYTRYVMGMIGLVMIFNNLDRTILSILVRPIKAEFSLTDTQMGLLLGPAFAIVYSILVLPFGRWADTTGVRRSIIAGCLVAWSGFTAATAFVGSYAQLFAVRMGVGVGEAGATAPSVSMLADYLPPTQRARGMSVISIGAILGIGLGMVVGGGIEQVYGWRAAFLAVGLPGVLIAIVFRWTVREPVRGAIEGLDAGAKVGFWPSLRVLLASRTYQFILLANALSLLAAMGRNLWEPSFLVRSYGMNELTAGSWYFLTSPVPSMFGIFLGGYLADRLGARDRRWYMWIPALGQLMSVPILVAFLLWPATDRIALPGFFAELGVSEIPVGFVFSFFGSIVGSFFTAPFMATIQGVSPLRMRAFAASISSLLSTLVGHALGPLIVGMVADGFAARFGDEALRYSLLVPTMVPLLSALVCLIGAGYVGRDLLRARSVANAATSDAAAADGGGA
jgi:MFS family permease